MMDLSAVQVAAALLSLWSRAWPIPNIPGQGLETKQGG